MGAPFLAQYAKEFDEPALFDDVVKQFVLMEKHARDDEDGPAVPRLGREPAAEVGRPRRPGARPRSGAARWAGTRWRSWTRSTSCPRITRAAKDLVGDPGPPRPRRWRKCRTRRPASGGRSLDQPGREGNYLESSVSVDVRVRAPEGRTRLGYLDAKYGAAGRRAYKGVLKEFVEVDADGAREHPPRLPVAGLGGDPGEGALPRRARSSTT